MLHPKVSEVKDNQDSNWQHICYIVQLLADDSMIVEIMTFCQFNVLVEALLVCKFTYEEEVIETIDQVADDKSEHDAK